MQIHDLILEISDSGKLAEIRMESGRIIAQFVVHGLLKKVAEHCNSGSEILAGKANIFRGELYQIAPYEYLDREKEVVLER